MYILYVFLLVWVFEFLYAFLLPTTYIHMFFHVVVFECACEDAL